MKKPHWKPAAKAREDVTAAAFEFIYRARCASKSARQHLARYRAADNTDFGAFEGWLRYRAERHNWICAARKVLAAVRSDIAGYSLTMRRRYDRAVERVDARLSASKEPHLERK